MPTTFHFRFVTDDCRVIGQIEADDAEDAYIKVLVADSGDGTQRWKRFGISQEVLNRKLIPLDAELVDITCGSHKYSLDLRKAGTRKRKPLRILDAWTQ